MKRLIFSLLLFAWVLVACTGSDTPRMIASSPRESSPGPVLISPSTEVIYNASLEMEVSDAEKTAKRAEALVERYGGYLVSSQLWYQDEHQHASVVLAVPAPNYDNLHDVVLDLGKLTNETVTGQLINHAPGGGTNTAYISVHFSPRAVSWPLLPLTGWNPGKTVQSAFRVFLTVFGFMADIVLWVVIVIGPFALMAWGGWAVIRKIRG